MTPIVFKTPKLEIVPTLLFEITEQASLEIVFEFVILPVLTIEPALTSTF